jgi:hypothetical protein
MKEVAYAALSWLSYIGRPMSLLELQYALVLQDSPTVLDEDDLCVEAAILTACAGLIVRVRGSQMVDFARESSLMHAFVSSEY